MPSVRSPVLGYNHNVQHRGWLFHVQTEDSGLQNPHIFTHLFHAGVIINSKKMVYDPEADADVIKGLMQAQHKSVLRELKKGKYDDKIDRYLGKSPAPTPAAEGAVVEVADVTDSGVVVEPSVPGALADADAGATLPTPTGPFEGDSSSPVLELELAAEPPPFEPPPPITIAPRGAGPGDGVPTDGTWRISEPAAHQATQPPAAAWSPPEAVVREPGRIDPPILKPHETGGVWVAKPAGKERPFARGDSAAPVPIDDEKSGAYSIPHARTTIPGDVAPKRRPSGSRTIPPTPGRTVPPLPLEQRQTGRVGDPRAGGAASRPAVPGRTPSAAPPSRVPSASARPAAPPARPVDRPRPGASSTLVRGTPTPTRTPSATSPATGRGNPMVPPARPSATPRPDVIVSRPAVIIGSEPATPTRRPARESKSGNDSIFGQDLLTEKSLDEVILAYLSDDEKKG